MEGKFELNIGKSISEFMAGVKKFRVKKLIYKSIFRGKGLEFDGYRYFEQDEDSSMIDWKASLRSNKLLARKYIEERDLNIYFVVDSSASMLFGSSNKLKAEYATEVISALSYLIMDSNDNVGLFMHNEKVTKFLEPGKSKKHFFILTKFLSDVKNYGGGYSLNQTLDEVLKRIKSEFSVVILVSDFLHLERGIEQKLRLLSARFETFAIMIRDNLDEKLPEAGGYLLFQDPYSQKQKLVETSVLKEKYSNFVLNQRKLLFSLFTKSNVDICDLKTEKSFILPLIAFLESRSNKTKGGNF